MSLRLQSGPHASFRSQLQASASNPSIVGLALEPQQPSSGSMAPTSLHMATPKRKQGSCLLFYFLGAVLVAWLERSRAPADMTGLYSLPAKRSGQIKHLTCRRVEGNDTHSTSSELLQHPQGKPSPLGMRNPSTNPKNLSDNILMWTSPSKLRTLLSVQTLFDQVLSLKLRGGCDSEEALPPSLLV